MYIYIYIWAKLVGNSISNSISWHACNTDSLFPDTNSIALISNQNDTWSSAQGLHNRRNSNQARAWSLTKDEGVILPLVWCLKGSSLLCQSFIMLCLTLLLIHLAVSMSIAYLFAYWIAYWITNQEESDAIKTNLHKKLYDLTNHCQSSTGKHLLKTIDQQRSLEESLR